MGCGWKALLAVASGGVLVGVAASMGAAVSGDHKSGGEKKLFHFSVPFGATVDRLDHPCLSVRANRLLIPAIRTIRNRNPPLAASASRHTLA
jgi:hypothetical protein